VRNLDGLNQLMADGLLEEQGRVITGRSQTIGAAMVAEREHLLPLASEGFDLAALHFPHINASGCALFQWWPEVRAEAFWQHMAERGIWVRLFQHAARGIRLGLPPDEASWQRLTLALDEWIKDKSE